MARGRKKKGRPVSGWVVLDKPLELGSTQAVSRIRRLFGADKAGHAGTLDPLATGMLPIALGEATKTVPFVTDGTKVYRFTVAWGAETSTDDLEGDITQTSAERPDRAAIEAILSDFIGEITQVPPQYSAIRIDGERAYDLARDGEAVDIAPRLVEIDELRILDHDGNATRFECVCGKGTYVRALARDMGRRLGCLGHITALRRTEVFPFAEADLVSLDELERLAEQSRSAHERALAEAGVDHADDLPIGVHAPSPFEAIDTRLLAPQRALEGLPEVVVGGEIARRIRLGNAMVLSGNAAVRDAEEAFATERGALIAIGRVEHGTFHPKRVING